MKRTTSIVLVSVALIAVIGATVLTRILPNRESHSTVASDQTLLLDRIEGDRIVRIELSSQDGTIALRKTDGEWRMESDPTLSLDDSALLNLVLDFSAVYADSVVAEQTTNLAQYGLEPPSVTATAFLDDGSRRIYHVGQKTAGDSYYMIRANDPRVYAALLKYGIHFGYTKNDFRDKTLFEFVHVTSVRLSRADLPAIELTRTLESSAWANSSGEAWWIMV